VGGATNCQSSTFWFEPGPDPFPVFASKRQAARPIATLFKLRLEVT